MHRVRFDDCSLVMGAVTRDRLLHGRNDRNPPKVKIQPFGERPQSGMGNQRRALSADWGADRNKVGSVRNIGGCAFKRFLPMTSASSPDRRLVFRPIPPYHERLMCPLILPR